MDLADLKRYATAAREFSVAVGPQDQPRNITLRMPTAHELMLVALRSRVKDVHDPSTANHVLQRNLLHSGVVAWSGVCVGDVLPDHAQASDVLPCEPDAVLLWLDANPEWENELGTALMKRLSDRVVQRDTAAKN